MSNRELLRVRFQAARASLARRFPMAQQVWWRVRHAGNLLRAETREAELEQIRERLGASEERRLLGQARGVRKVCWPGGADGPQPLVSVRIATYRRGDLIKRSLDSVLSQTHSRLEVLVIGDACDEPTQIAVESYTDPRVRFINLPTRGLYPEDAQSRWMVAGTHPMNAALPLLTGQWIAPCDDDD